MGVVTVIGEHSEAVAQGSGGNQQVNRVNPGSLTAVDQVRLDLPRRDTSPVVQFHPDDSGRWCPAAAASGSGLGSGVAGLCDQDSCRAFQEVAQ
jgi:hypothetical protein